MGLLCKVVNIKGEELLPAEEKKVPSLWEEAFETILKLAATLPEDQLIAVLEKTYKIEKR